MADSGNGQTRTIRTEALARVEGEGEMYVRVRGDEVLDVELRIYEPPRLFEALLRGRSFTEAPDITARVCGICPVAYQMSACEAMEDALGVSIPDEVRVLRRLIYCGEWLESHSLHLYMLHAPDFLGYESAFAMAREHGEIVERGLRTKKAGNQLIVTIGGREIHPINVRVGGFYRAPDRRDLEPLRDQLARAREEAVRDRALDRVAALPRAGARLRIRGLALARRASTRSTAGGSSPRAASTSKSEGSTIRSRKSRCRIRTPFTAACGVAAPTSLGRWPASTSTSTGSRRPLAEAAEEAGIGSGCRNPFQSIVVRAVEILYACDEAVRLIDAYEPPDPPAIEPRARAAVGHGVTEAPRGLLYHRYELGDEGEIRTARIVPPTSQNQRTIEEDLHEFVQRNLELDDDELTLRCEQTIRNYDPCISCATHFLRLEVDRV